MFFVAAPAARGKGYITAALRAVATWALLERVSSAWERCDAAARNGASGTTRGSPP